MMLRRALAVLGLLVLLGLLAASPAAADGFAVPAFEQVRQSFRSSESLLLDRDGEPLQRMRTDATVRRGPWLALEDASPALRDALLLSEDQRFYEHAGIDWRAVAAAGWSNLWHRRIRGASTISMQVAGLLDPELRAGARGRGLVQKLKQALLARRLEARWRKDQILEAYLNLVPLRGELVGMDALSRTLFGKRASGLDARESAIAAVLVRGPNAAPSAVARRACQLFRRMHAAMPDPLRDPARTGATAPAATAPPDPRAADARACDALSMLSAAALQRRAFDSDAGVAPHLARRVLAAGAPPRQVRSTLRAPLQRFALHTLQRNLRELRARHVEDGAVVVLDNASGEVLAWVGSSGEISQAAQVDGVTALRQPGSALKPFLYAQAIAEGRITAASLLDDAPTHIATASGLYIPQNYDHHFKGWVSARTALAASLNVPAVRTLEMVSPDAFHQQLLALGLPLRESGDFYGYSLALGSAEVSLLSLANAYRALANGGQIGAPCWVLQDGATPRCSATRSGGETVPLPATRNPAPTPVLDPRAAFIVADILSDPIARAHTFGTDSLLATPFWSAVKTGTSKDMRDNWALGFSSRYTVGVWIGNASGAPMWDVSGISGAAPVWAALMQFLHQAQTSLAPAPPPGLVRTRVEFDRAAGGDQPVEAARSEWFLSGTEQTRIVLDADAYADEYADANAKARDVAAAGSGTDGRPRARADYGTVGRPRARADRGAPGRASGSASVDVSRGVARIVAPAPGTIIALDPDIPPLHQRVQFLAQGQQLQWLLDGKALGRGARLSWFPWPGRHRVQLADARGRVLDEVRIEVRGAAALTRR